MAGPEQWAERVAEMVRKKLRDRSRLPEVTYRVQFRPEQFTFQLATAVVPYLDRLGISHVYASPYLKARPGSAHGYDVTDHNRLNPELGTPDDFQQFVDALHEHGMGQILDIVPNHMGIATSENRWWNDVLENGPSSPFGHFFDIDWLPVKPELRNKVLLPMLGEQYGQVLESGQLQLKRHGGAFVLQYYELELPLEPKSSLVLLSHRLDELRDELGAESEPVIELESIRTALDHLPPCTKTDAASVCERQREKEVIKGRIDRLIGEHPEVGAFLDRNIDEFNGDPANPHSFDPLDKLLEQQVYRLCHWKAASDEINYRRFFDINELAAICTEEPDVFEETHRFIFELLANGSIDGLRIDHIDGLFDPEEYLWRLQWGYLRAVGRRAYARLRTQAERSRVPVQATVAAGNERHATLPEEAETEDAAPEWDDVQPAFIALMRGVVGGPPYQKLFPATASPAETDGQRTLAAPPAWTRRGLPLYVVVEKILEAHEDLPASWPVAGTTGYEFLNVVAGLAVDAAGARLLEKRYQRFTGQKKNLPDIVYQCKRLIINVAMSAELQHLAVRIGRLSEQHRRFRDFTLNNLRAALRDIIACFPIYRTYITADSAAGVSERDQKFIVAAVRHAGRLNASRDVRLFEFVRDVLLLRQPPDLDQASLRARRFFVGRFQQVTSPAVAKGVEDTAFYRYFPLCSLNEVGGGFDTLRTTEDFHAENAARQARRSGSLLCSTSHDTKRSEDVRARISILSQIPKQWNDALSRWSRFNRRHRHWIDGEPAPSRNDEYLFYQTLVGVWPLQPPRGVDRERLIARLQEYMQKATHEAKVHTSWVNPDPDYDEAVSRFVQRVLSDDSENSFVDRIQAFHERVVDWGLHAALSQLVLKLMSPGVPDVYQGQEIWDFSLVDPDNRRPVDYEYRENLLARLQQELEEEGADALPALARRLAGRPRDDRLKLFVTWRSLCFRRRQRSLFQDGRYVPLNVTGSRAEHVVAFAWLRESSGGWLEELAVVAVPRLVAMLATDGYPYTSPERSAEEIWTDTAIQLQDVPESSLANLFTGQTVPRQGATVRLADILADFPVAILCKQDLAEDCRRPTD